MVTLEKAVVFEGEVVTLAEHGLFGRVETGTVVNHVEGTLLGDYLLAHAERTVKVTIEFLD